MRQNKSEDRPKGLDGQVIAERNLRRALARVRDFLQASEECLSEGGSVRSPVKAMAAAASDAVAEAGSLDVFRLLSDGTYKAAEPGNGSEAR